MSSQLAAVINNSGKNAALMIVGFIFKAVIVYLVLELAGTQGEKYCGGNYLGSKFAGVVGSAGKLAGTAALGAAS